MKKPFYISSETWKDLSWKEQDFIVLLREKKRTQSQIMRRLYITTRQGYHKLLNKVKKKIETDVNKVYK